MKACAAGVVISVEIFSPCCDDMLRKKLRKIAIDEHQIGLAVIVDSEIDLSA